MMGPDYETHRLFEAAIKVPLAEYTGEYVTPGGDHDDIALVRTKDAAADSRHLVAEDGTKFFWAMSPLKCFVDDLECELDGWLADHHDDAHEQVNEDKLEEAIKLINEALSGVVSYYENTNVAVVLP